MLQNEVARQPRDEHNTKSGQHNTSGATSPQRPHHRNGATRQTARQVEQLFVPVAPLSGATRAGGVDKSRRPGPVSIKVGLWDRPIIRGGETVTKTTGRANRPIAKLLLLP